MKAGILIQAFCNDEGRRRGGILAKYTGWYQLGWLRPALARAVAGRPICVLHIRWKHELICDEHELSIKPPRI